MLCRYFAKKTGILWQRILTRVEWFCLMWGISSRFSKKIADSSQLIISLILTKVKVLLSNLPMKSCPFPFNCRSLPGEAPVTIGPLSTRTVAVCSILQIKLDKIKCNQVTLSETGILWVNSWKSKIRIFTKGQKIGKQNRLEVR